MSSATDIRVRVAVGAKREFIDRLPNGSYHVAVTEPAEGGKANLRVRELIAEHFYTPVKNVHIVRGAQTHAKIVRVWESR